MMASSLEESDSKESSLSSQSSTLHGIAEKAEAAVDKIAKDRNLERSVIINRLPAIDICVFGRSGIGKSELIRAITGLDLPASPQLDHVTQILTHVTTTIGSLTFRFWDTKGIDNWLDIDTIDNMFNEMKEKEVRPMFAIYCSAASGRTDSDIVAGILKRFHDEKILICYVITNMYAASLDQLNEQVKGGLKIMDSVFGCPANKTDDYCYQYKEKKTGNENCSIETPGILISVNSCLFRHHMGTFPAKNIYELMDFLSGNLDDSNFTKFVALTMNNRGFWSRVADATRTRALRVSKALEDWKIKAISYFKKLFHMD